MKWVIGRYVGNMWYWLALGAVDSFTSEVCRAEHFTSFKQARAALLTAECECIVTLEAAQAIAERWAKWTLNLR